MDNKICDLPDGYVPSEDEEFMNNMQREYFRRKLVSWMKELLSDNDEVMQSLNNEGKSCTDIADKASIEADLAYEFRSKERSRKLISKIQDALVKIKNGTYGYCEETGETISLKRLEARPVAILCIEAQKRHEKHESSYRDDDD